MTTSQSTHLLKRPLIGCTTYRKTVNQTMPIEILGLMPAYIKAIEAVGGIPLLIPLGLQTDTLASIIAQVDGILLPGGGDMDPNAYQGALNGTLYGIDADRDRVEIFIAQQVVKQEKPFLAICRGHQVLNVALGGSLWEDVPSMMPNALPHDNYRHRPRNFVAHTVDITVDSKVAHCLNKTVSGVNSLHHQGIRELAAELTVTAVAPDGLIESSEIDGHPFAVSVQWHPENLVHDDPDMFGLFRGLVDAARVA